MKVYKYIFRPLFFVLFTIFLVFSCKSKGKLVDVVTTDNRLKELDKDKKNDEASVVSDIEIVSQLILSGKDKVDHLALVNFVCKNDGEIVTINYAIFDKTGDNAFEMIVSMRADDDLSLICEKLTVRSIDNEYSASFNEVLLVSKGDTVELKVPSLSVISKGAEDGTIIIEGTITECEEGKTFNKNEGRCE